MKPMSMMILLLYAALAAGCATLDMSTEGDGKGDALVQTLADGSQGGDQ